jgi:hypothetical protein
MEKVKILEFIKRTKDEIQQIVSNSKASDRDVLARYTAATAVNFTDWVGKTIPWVRHELSRQVLIDNLRCETVDDHVGMLLNFTTLSGAMPERSDYSHVEEELKKVRSIFNPIQQAGLSGLALCAMLESTSEIFIPDLAERAKRLGCKDFTYTDVHGVADVAHSDGAIKALQCEVTMGYPNWGLSIDSAQWACTILFSSIYK